ncbi:MAG: deoxyribonuclease V [Dehalococcoidales bacterium]|nr:deoxyribonuclease V [Dehalococcoidales bacterium]
MTTDRAREIQEALAKEVSRSGDVPEMRMVAGIDVSVNRWNKTGTAAVVVLDYPALTIVETSVVSGDITFPYVPGLLSFREAPLVLEACERLKAIPDVIMVDGQGVAHPRRIGLASHLGLCLEVPVIGCAKSRLCGTHEEPGPEAGSTAELVESGEIIGSVLRTRRGVKPVYVSVGHMVDLPAAVRLVLGCCRGYRLPEPTRLAHQAAGGHLRNYPVATR